MDKWRSNDTNLLAITLSTLHLEFQVFQIAFKSEKVHNSVTSLLKQDSFSYCHVIIMSNCHVAGSVATASGREDRGGRNRSIFNK